MIVPAADFLQNPTAGMAQRLFRCRKAPLSITLLAALLLTANVAADAFDQAVAASDRPAADRDRDLNSHPAEVLRFFETPEQGVIIDLFAGGGYYSEILSHYLGPESVIYMHNNAAYLGFAGDSVEQRLAGDRLQNVVRYDRELDAIDLEDDSVDMMLMVMTYHDLYYKTEDWDLDPDAFFATAQRILKPGGVLAIVDHEGMMGSGSSAAQELHRIDPEFAKADIESHGFKLESRSELLKNPDDTLQITVFDPSIRGKTSKFLYRFRAP